MIKLDALTGKPAGKQEAIDYGSLILQLQAALFNPRPRIKCQCVLPERIFQTHAVLKSRAMIQIQNLSLHRGTQQLLAQTSLTFHAGWKVGIVGANGVGKSSLFKLLLGQLQPDGGELQLPSRLRIAHMAQEVDTSERSALDYVVDGDTVCVPLRPHWQSQKRSIRLTGSASCMPSWMRWMAIAPKHARISYWPGSGLPRMTQEGRSTAFPAAGASG